MEDGSGSVERSKKPVGALLGPLTDFSFTRFITLDVLKVLYVIMLILVTLWTLAVVVAGFSQGLGAGIGALVLAPIVWLLSVLLVRVYLEIIAVIFRIAQNTTTLVEMQGGSAARTPE